MARLAAGLPLIAAVAVGCTVDLGGSLPGTPPADAGAGDGGADGGDGGGERALLSVAFATRESIPGKVGGPREAEVELVELAMDDLRAIGDVGATGAVAVDLVWDEEERPRPIGLAGVTAGLYAQLRGTVRRYAVYGEVEIAQGNVEFEIVDDAPPPSVALAVDLGALVVAAGTAHEIDVDIHLKRVLEVVPWDSIAPDPDGVIRIDGADAAAIDAVRSRWPSAFSLGD
ncbi:MAG: hypothetical protein D6689_03925 [Deltaproteobacteria bacterium]|nr:MAG: hypothetical protein D6689_03925 [Deltaproteobacteria bacterium]